MTPTTPPSFFAPPGEPTTVRTVEEVGELARWLTNRNRIRPVVVLTARNQDQDPYFSPFDVVPLVAGAGDIVVIQQTRKSALTVELSRVMPDGMGVFNGAARVYWPIDLAGSHPSRHPLVLADSPATSAAERRARLANRWRSPPQGLRITPGTPTPAPSRPVATAAERPRPVRSTALTSTPVSDGTGSGVVSTPPRSRPVRLSVTTPDPPMSAPPTPAEVPTPSVPAPKAAPAASVPAACPTASRPVGPGEDALRLAITGAWLSLLPDPADRNRFGLQPYRLHRELAAQLEIHEPARDQVAAAAARVISGYAWTQVSPVPRRVEQDGVPVIRDGDHAVGWRYPLPDDERFLFYWQPASGPIVLARIGPDEHTELPEKGAALAPRHQPDPQRPQPQEAATLPDPRIAALEAALQEQRDELARLATKLADAPPADAPSALPATTEPTPPTAAAEAAPRKATPPPRGGNARPRSIDVADAALVRVLREAGEPLTARALRAALGIDPAVPGHHVTRMLNRALSAGVIEKTGNRQGARYFAS